MTFIVVGVLLLALVVAASIHYIVVRRLSDRTKAILTESGQETFFKMAWELSHDGEGTARGIGTRWVFGSRFSYISQSRRKDEYTSAEECYEDFHGRYIPRLKKNYIAMPIIVIIAAVLAFARYYPPMEFSIAVILLPSFFIVWFCAFFLIQRKKIRMVEMIDEKMASCLYK